MDCRVYVVEHSEVPNEDQAVRLWGLSCGVKLIQVYPIRDNLDIRPGAV